jgi:hypothetical protein
VALALKWHYAYPRRLGGLLKVGFWKTKKRVKLGQVHKIKLEVA